MNDVEVAKALGKCVGAWKPMLCPLCSPDAMDNEQPMSSYGDYENQLFCPHCDLHVKLVIITNPSNRENKKNEILV